MKPCQCARYERCDVCSPPGEGLHELPPKTKAALLYVLWHHQGANSEIGQALRKLLRKGQYDQLTASELDAAKSISQAADRVAVPRDTVYHIIRAIENLRHGHATYEWLLEQLRALLAKGGE